MRAYYNEFDPKAAAWLRELIAADLIASGDVDERSIAEVRASDLVGYRQCHFFAGIGGWSYALRLAGFPDDREVWTGSCPCQPFSAAGKGDGASDARHLWPEFGRLIQECRPPVVFGEQVASALGRLWLTAVRLDLEDMGYAVGAADLCAAGVGAPHIRQRLFWVADRDGERCDGESVRLREWGSRSASVEAAGSGPACGLAHAERLAGEPGRLAVGPRGRDAADQRGAHAEPGRSGDAGGVDFTDRARQQPEGQGPEGEARDETRVCGPERGRATGGLADAVPAVRAEGRAESGRGSAPSGGGVGGVADALSERGRGRPAGLEDASDAGQSSEAGGPGRPGFWDAVAWLPCRDGKARPVEPGTFPLVAGLPRSVVPSGDPSPSYAQATAEGRIMRLRGYGNSIVPEIAAAFIEAYQAVTTGGER